MNTRRGHCYLVNATGLVYCLELGRFRLQSGSQSGNEEHRKPDSGTNLSAVAKFPSSAVILSPRCEASDKRPAANCWENRVWNIWHDTCDRHVACRCCDAPPEGAWLPRFSSYFLSAKTDECSSVSIGWRGLSAWWLWAAACCSPLAAEPAFPTPMRLSLRRSVNRASAQLAAPASPPWTREIFIRFRASSTSFAAKHVSRFSKSKSSVNRSRES